LYRCFSVTNARIAVLTNGQIDADKTETRHLIESLDDIYLHAEVIRSTVRTLRG
jgi:hypothetical protein